MTKDPRLKIYLSSLDATAPLVLNIFGNLKDKGFQVFWPDTDILAGSRLEEATQEAIRNSDVVILPISENSLSKRFLTTEARIARSNNKKIIPLYIDFGEPPTLPEDLRIINEYKSVFISIQHTARETTDTISKLLKDLEKLEESGAHKVSLAQSISSRAPRESPIVRKIVLENIRCFEHFEIELENGNNPTLLSMVLGDNAAGKSALLRSIALGLCSEASASALLKELPGPMIRHGQEEGKIRLELADLEDDRELVITTLLTRGATDERVRQDTEPETFPWDDLFVCAYGTNRSREATASYESYTTHQAVRPLFDEGVSLQNPELVLLRQPGVVRDDLERRLLHLMMLDDEEHGIRYPREGSPLIRGPWGEQPYTVLSDGYRSTLQWLVDFLGWAMYAGRLGNGGEIGGILLIDEIEQHLHPSWQRHVLERLRRIFPKTQIFASTHTPLVAASVADVKAAKLLRLKAHADGSIETIDIDPQSLYGLRADQVLASDAFGLLTTRNPGSTDDVDRYAELLGVQKRTDAEEKELEKLAAKLEESLSTEESPAAREVEKVVDDVLKQKALSIDPGLLDVEAKRQLREIFGKGEKK